MTKIPFLMALMTALLLFLSCTLAANDEEIFIDDLFKVHNGATDGGCGGRATVLDDWLTETIDSLDIALKAMDNYKDNWRVRRSLSTIFTIKNDRIGTPKLQAFKDVKGYLEAVRDFFNRRRDDAGQQMYVKDGYWLFCDSKFLSEQQPTDTALDYLGVPIMDDKDQPVLINSVDEYKKQLGKDAQAKPWWAGTFTDLNAYFFTQHGADYCDGEGHLGVTASVTPYKKGDSGMAEAAAFVYSTTLCPSSFEGTVIDGIVRYETYKEANARITPEANLADFVPRSTTLLHEAFHFIHGPVFKIPGDKKDKNAEKWDIVDCLRFSTKNAIINAENYVFFIAHMYHLFGKSENVDVGVQWDFKLKSQVFGASEPTKDRRGALQLKDPQ